jgi:hypothetical protein
MICSVNISSLAAALVNAQKAFSPALKQSVNPHFKSKYVDLASAIEAAQPALLDNGIAVIQGTSGNMSEQSITVTTRILHSSGEWIEDALTLPAVNRSDFSAQSAGSAITYARRYSYMAILGFAPEDDDGTAASQPSPNHVPAVQQAPVAARFFSSAAKISEAQGKRFFAICKQSNKSNDDIKRYLMDVCKCEKTLDMTKDKYEAACKWAESIFEYRPAPDSPEITDDDVPF